MPSERPEIEREETYLNIFTFFYIKWRPLPHDKWNGNPRGYKVFYRAGDTGAFHTKTVPPDALEANITIESDPAPYEMRVAAFTRAGNGPMSDPRERRGNFQSACSYFSRINMLLMLVYEANSSLAMALFRRLAVSASLFRIKLKNPECRKFISI